MDPAGTECVARNRPREGFRSALSAPDFRTLFAAEVQSILGDQLGRVALSFLVFLQTGSAASTGITYALTYLPALLSGTIFGAIADRYPRHRVMVGCDALRAVLFATMAVPGLPLVVVAVLLILAVMIGPVFTAAEVSYLAHSLSGDRFRAASGLRMIAGQAGQVAGFALGGVVVVALGARPALAMNAVTFAVSAAVIALRVSPQPKQQRPSPGPGGTAVPVAFRGLWHDRQLRHLNALSCLAAFFVVPEGLALPFVAQIHAPTVTTGLLLAAIPLGGTVGAVLVIRFVPQRDRSRVSQMMAMLCGLPLVLSGILPGVVSAFVCWFVSGVLAAYQVEVIASIARAIPDAVRAKYVARAGALLIGAQGVGLIVFAAATRVVAPATAIAIAGGLGSLAALVLALTPARMFGPARVSLSVRS